RRTIREHARNKRATWLFEAERCGQFATDILDLHTEPAAFDVTTLDQLLRHVHGDVDGDGKRYALIAAGAAVNLGIDAHNLAFEVEQRPTRIARIDGHVRLYEGNILIAAKHALLGGNYACSHGSIETERRPDRQHP